MPIEHIPGGLPPSLEEERRILIEQIQIIQRDYERQIEPYRRRLVELEHMRGPGHLIVTGDDLKNCDFARAKPEHGDDDAVQG